MNTLCLFFIVLYLVGNLPFFPFLCQLESISEDTAIADKKQISLNNFLPCLRSGEWSDIGSRSDMEDTHVCIEDLAKNFGYNLLGEEAISFYGVSSLTSSESCLLPTNCFIINQKKLIKLERFIANVMTYTPEHAYLRSCSDIQVLLLNIFSGV